MNKDILDIVWQQSPGTLAVVQDNVTTLLALDHGRYLRLNSVAAFVWRRLEAATCGREVLDALVIQYGHQVERQKLGEDLRHLLEKLSSIGVARRRVAGIGRPRHLLRWSWQRGLRREPSITYCLTHLVVIHLGLKLFGARDMLWLASRSIQGRRARDSDAVLVLKTRRHAELAAALCPLRAKCLPRSLSLTILLRRLGIPAVLEIGVTSYPFFAHAWVELDGVPVNEHPDALVRYQSFKTGGAL